MAAEFGRIDFMFLAPPPYPTTGSATGYYYSFFWIFDIFHLNVHRTVEFRPHRIGNFNIKAWKSTKTTEYILHRIWRSLKFCKI